MLKECKGKLTRRQSNERSQQQYLHTKQKKNNFDANRKCVSPMLHFMCNIVVAVVLCLCSHFLPSDSICFFSCRIKKWTKTINFVYRCCCFCCLCFGRWKNIFKNMMNGWEWLTSEKWKKSCKQNFILILAFLMRNDTFLCSPFHWRHEQLACLMEFFAFFVVIII